MLIEGNLLYGKPVGLGVNEVKGECSIISTIVTLIFFEGSSREKLYGKDVRGSSCLRNGRLIA